MKVIDWFKALFKVHHIETIQNREKLVVEGIERSTKSLVAELGAANYLINKLKEEVNALKRWTVDVDVFAHERSSSTVIITGVYKGKDYVRIYDVEHNNMDELVQHLSQLSRIGQTRSLDTPRNHPLKEVLLSRNIPL